MKQWLCLAALLALSSPVGAQDAITTATDVQDGTIGITGCYNGVTLLPANVWTLVLFDDAGNPCTTHASQLTGTCNPDSTWNWTVDGHLVFTTAPGYLRVRVRVQVWSGGGGGACYGGTSDPITCDNPYYKLLKQDETYESDLQAIDRDPTSQGETDVAAPFSVLGYLLAPYFAEPSDANFQGLWIFAMPIGDLSGKGFWAECAGRGSFAIGDRQHPQHLGPHAHSGPSAPSK
jgi:hypothetical protein